MSKSSKLLKTSCTGISQSTIACSPAAKLSPNSVISAPTINVDLPEVTIKPLMSLLALTAAIAAWKSSMVARLNLLTDSPCKSKRNSAIPSASIWTVMALPAWIMPDLPCCGGF